MADRMRNKGKQSQFKKEKNPAVKKYNREEILRFYSDSPLPVLHSLATDLISSPSLPPCTLENPVFSCQNSRRPQGSAELLPEWYTDESFQKVKSLKLEEIEEEYSKVDVKYEESIKKPIEEDENYPEWDDPKENTNEATSPEVIIYPLSLIQSSANEGNPFACIIMAHSITNEDNVITNPYSIPFEQVWYYKDPQNNIQGPFTTIDMFNWSAAGYFSSNLQIAHSSPYHFFSLKMYVLQEKYKSLASSL